MISFEGTRFCTAQEYKDNLHNRYTPEELNRDEDYTLMSLAREPAKLGGESVAYPLRCITYPETFTKKGYWIVKFAVLDADCNPDPTGINFIIAGDGMVLLDKDTWAKEAYIKSYDDGLGNELLQLYDSQDLVLAR